MPVSPVRFDSVESLRPAFDAIRDDLGVDVGFAPDVVAEAEAAAKRGPTVSAARDLRDLPFITLDPAGSRDLDQALAIERSTRGYVVHYAIADVAAFVDPGGAIDRAARERVVTMYLPDGRAPLHPPVLSEGAASLLAEGDRQALAWRLEVSDDGELSRVHVERATVRNRRAYAYPEAQAELDRGTADDTIALLGELGPMLERRERERGGVSLNLPEQVVSRVDGHYELAFRAPLPLERWNAQISLLTGMAAAQLMIDGGVGILRSLPLPPDDEVQVLRRHARGLDISWPRDESYPDLIRRLDPNDPDHAALLAQAGRLFRGSGYHAFDTEAGLPVPVEPAHAAVAAPYAHVTAPLRRLVDRFANEIVLAVCADREPDGWARDALAELPDRMADGRQREGAADARATDVVEAAVLAGCVGETLDAVVVRLTRHGTQVQLRSPAVVATAPAAAGAQLGDEVKVLVRGADPTAPRVDLAIVS